MCRGWQTISSGAQPRSASRPEPFLSLETTSDILAFSVHSHLCFVERRDFCCCLVSHRCTPVSPFVGRWSNGATMAMLLSLLRVLAGASPYVRFVYQKYFCRPSAPGRLSGGATASDKNEGK